MNPGRRESKDERRTRQQSQRDLRSSATPDDDPEFLRAELRRLLDAFVFHRTQHHEVAPHFCKTCRQADGVIDRVKRILANQPVPALEE